MSRKRTGGIQEDPADSDPYYDWGWVAQSLGKTRTAIARYRQSIRVRNYYKAHYNVGTIWLARRRYRDAVKAFRAAIKARPDLSEAYNNLGVALDHLGERRNAMTAYARAIALDPRDPTAFVNLGRDLARRGQRQRARALFRKALTLRPRDLETKRWVGYALIESGLAVADGIRLLEVVRQRRKDSLLLSDLAEGYQRIGMVKKAERLLRQSKALASDDKAEQRGAEQRGQIWS